MRNVRKGGGKSYITVTCHDTLDSTEGGGAGGLSVAGAAG